MNQETPFASKRAPVAGLALMQQLVSDKVDLQKRLDAALATIESCVRDNDTLRAENNRLADEIGVLKKQEPVAWIEAFPFGPGNKGIYRWSEYPIGTKFYIAAGAQPTPMTQDEAEALAHRRCSRYIFIDTKAPYQFGLKDLLDFVRDIEKGTRV